MASVHTGSNDHVLQTKGAVSRFPLNLIRQSCKEPQDTSRGPIKGNSTSDSKSALHS